MEEKASQLKGDFQIKHEVLDECDENMCVFLKEQEKEEEFISNDSLENFFVREETPESDSAIQVNIEALLSKSNDGIQKRLKSSCPDRDPAYEQSIRSRDSLKILLQTSTNALRNRPEQPACEASPKKTAETRPHMRDTACACEVCAESCQSVGIPSRAQRARHSFQCAECAYSGDSKNRLAQHIMSSHTGQRPLSCKRCDYRAVRKDALRKHVDVHHSGKKHLCNVCHESFSVRFHLTRHQSIHVKSSRYKCHYECSFACGSRELLHEHVSRVHLGGRKWKRLACPYCDYRTNDGKSMAEHKRTHTGDRPFCCAHCDYRSITKKSLVDHLRLHMGLKLFKCELCPYAGVNRSQLKKHRGVHSSASQVACPKCEAVVARHLFKQHSLTHSKRKVLACDRCDFKSTNRCELDRHSKTHGGELLSCDQCAFVTVHAVSMRRHALIHTDFVLLCPLCDYRTRYKSNLARHKEKWHPAMASSGEGPTVDGNGLPIDGGRPPLYSGDVPIVSGQSSYQQDRL